MKRSSEFELSRERPRLGGEAQGTPRATTGQSRGQLGVTLVDTVPAPQPGFDRRGRDRSEDDRLAARADRLGQLLRVRGREQQVGARWWLFEGLQQVVSRLLGQALGARDDRDPAPARVGGKRKELLERRARLVVGGAALGRRSHPIDPQVLR